MELTDNEKVLLEKVSSEMMTDEETDDEGTGFVARKIPWRIEEMNLLIIKIDRVNRDGGGLQKPRRLGTRSTRNPSTKVPDDLKRFFDDGEYNT